MKIKNILLKIINVVFKTMKLTFYKFTNISIESHKKLILKNMGKKQQQF